MLLADTLVHIGLAVLPLGTINESDGVQERTFWLRNDGTEAVTLYQGYTSCGCTTIDFAKDSEIAVGDSTAVILRFNPKGKGGEFYESGTVVYGKARKRVVMAMEGTCITSEETLLKQFPVYVDDYLRISTNRFDLGIMRPGERKERNVAILHKDEGNRQEYITVAFEVTADMEKGLQHITRPIIIKRKGKDVRCDIVFDVMIK